MFYSWHLYNDLHRVWQCEEMRFCMLYTQFSSIKLGWARKIQWVRNSMRPQKHCSRTISHIRHSIHSLSCAGFWGTWLLASIDLGIHIKLLKSKVSCDLLNKFLPTTSRINSCMRRSIFPAIESGVSNKAKKSSPRERIFRCLYSRNEVSPYERGQNKWILYNIFITRILVL